MRSRLYLEKGSVSHGRNVRSPFKLKKMITRVKVVMEGKERFTECFAVGKPDRRRKITGANYSRRAGPKEREDVRKDDRAAFSAGKPVQTGTESSSVCRRLWTL